MLGRNCSRRHCSQRDLWQQHELHSQLPGWSRLGKCHTRPALCCRPTRSHLPLHRRHSSSSSGCGQRTWNSLLHDHRQHCTSEQRGWCEGSPSESCYSTMNASLRPTCEQHRHCNGISRSPCCASSSTSPSWNPTSPASNWRSQRCNHRFAHVRVPLLRQRHDCGGGSCHARCQGIPSAYGRSTRTSCVQTIRRTNWSSLHGSHSGIHDAGAHR
mmetsp:Transcript_75628/g.119876  ORF Transcript_75628/g.119876 Transcript_75628/m.119876 type:complete len:214 (-) Transcript_75628:625-1266(-)